MSEHTPEPWQIWDASECGDGLLVATRIGPATDGGIWATGGQDLKGQCKDLRLVASAPDLLAACRDDRLSMLQSLINESLRHAEAIGDGDANAVLLCCHELQQMHDDLSNAFAKATGGQP